MESDDHDCPSLSEGILEAFSAMNPIEAYFKAHPFDIGHPRRHIHMAHQ